MFNTVLKHFSRSYSTKSNINLEALDKWISSPRQLVLSDTFHQEHLSDLYITLPTRDGTRKPYFGPKETGPLEFGHHLVFFHNRTPESQLRDDGTDADFCPPEPFTRRMWAGGKMTWDLENPLLIGGKANVNWSISAVEKKGFDDPKKNPMVFVNQKIDITLAGRTKPSVSEERSHVYLSTAADPKTVTREVRDLPTSSDFSFRYKPTLTTLFRFSALTFNGHYIHLDQEFAQRKEGYPERLVHGPLTAMMLLETTVFHNPSIQITSFEYRARNPVIVNRPTTIHGVWKEKNTVALWCVDDDGIVGMTGTVEVI